MSHNTALNMEEVRHSILQAAMARFTRYGYNKTTMAEIAKDCHMSAANLYRYFENKLAIGEALACSCLDEKLARLTAIVEQRERNAGERLSELIMLVLEYTHEQWSSIPHMNELVNAICGECMEVVAHYKQREHALLMDLLQQGVARGEFEVTDRELTATAIATTLVPFSHPLLMPLYPLEVFRGRAQAVADLLLQGLLSR